MKIGISCYPTFGGSGVVASELAMSLAKLGDEVHVISYALPSRLDMADPGLSYHEVVVPHYPLFDYPPYSLALATKMVEVARHEQLDLLHVHYAVPNAISAILARDILAPQQVKVVTTLHGTDITLVGNDPNYLETTRFSIERSDAVTAVSDYLRRASIEQLGVTKKIEVIPNFIDLDRYCAIGAGPESGGGARRWARGDEAVLVHISNFRPVKRVLDVVSVFEGIRKVMPARLLLVGDGPERSKVEKHCRDCGTCDSISFLGHVAPVERVLAGADLFLLPSEMESFGLAALEALSCEVPVIATRAGGLPEVVEDGVDGYLRDVGDTEAMTAAALDLLQNPDKRLAFGRAARKRATKRFSEAAVVKHYRDLYASVISGQPVGVA